MSVFIDSGVFFSAYSKEDENHLKAVKLLEQALIGEYGKVFTSTHIFNETVTLVKLRSKDDEIAINIGEAILSSEKIKVLPVKSDIFDEAWDIFKLNKDRAFSYTDCTSIALIRKHKINKILSFDTEFEGILERIFI